MYFHLFLTYIFVCISTHFSLHFTIWTLVLYFTKCGIFCYFLLYFCLYCFNSSFVPLFPTILVLFYQQTPNFHSLPNFSLFLVKFLIAVESRLAIKVSYDNAVIKIIVIISHCESIESSWSWRPAAFAVRAGAAFELLLSAFWVSASIPIYWSDPFSSLIASQQRTLAPPRL